MARFQRTRVLLRALAAVSTLAAAMLMGFTEQQTVVFGLIPVHASYKSSPAFRFFLYGNAIASGYSLLSLLLSALSDDNIFIHLLDMNSSGLSFCCSSQNPCEMGQRKLVLLLVIIAYSLVILSTLMFPSKHALCPLFPAFTVPELVEMSSQFGDTDSEEQSNHDFSVRNLDYSVDLAQDGNLVNGAIANKVQEFSINSKGDSRSRQQL
ncbi:hypothetical protein J5N97_026079 [Dioscorea zingiberensis]|uniref:CASP-like protein n=1 Tax=Dioscorea zingiberensis TaxID=325984 RepID=A0A9D5C1E8_9LILI|nr:hypothetical protein J5N97_026079 [Dioscorea zingiberensis]